MITKKVVQAILLSMILLTSVFVSYNFVNADSPHILSAKALKLKKKKAKKKACNKYQLLGQNYSASSKDIDGDFLLNNKELTLFKTDPNNTATDNDSLSDIYELCISHTNPHNADSDGDGINDGEDPDTNTPNSGDSSTFCDENGNTQGFAIPAGLVGNRAAGESKYNSFCVVCHPTSNGLQGEGKLFDALDLALKSAPMNFNLPTQTVADITAFLNASFCTSAPPPGDPIPSPSSTPEPSPSVSPSPTTPPTTGNCDELGNTEAGAFGIPTGLSGNITAGDNTFHSVCSGCHVVDKGVNYSFQALQQAVTGSPMFITSLSNQQFADLVAYLNRANCTTSGEPTPSPTPPPTLEELGYQYFVSMCSSCHSPHDPEPEWTANKIHHAFHDVDEMEALGWEPTPAQLTALAAYFSTLHDH